MPFDTLTNFSLPPLRQLMNRRLALTMCRCANRIRLRVRMFRCVSRILPNQIRFKVRMGNAGEWWTRRDLNSQPLRSKRSALSS